MQEGRGPKPAWVGVKGMEQETKEVEGEMGGEEEGSELHGHVDLQRLDEALV